MSFFDRMSNGWALGMTSLKTIWENKKLLVFPALSGIALVAVCLSFFGGAFAIFGRDFEAFFNRLEETNEILLYAILFAFYLVSYFIIVFFNVALVHCARLIFAGQEATIKEGLNYSGSRIVSIGSWAILAATVGVILKFLEDRLGWLGQIVIGIIGMVWSIATFFVVPILAYEDLGPIDALKRSGAMMKEKWGESIGANFSFGVFYLLGYFFIVIAAIALFFVHPILAIVSAVLAALLLHTVVSASKTVFIAATYNHMTDKPAGRFDDDQMLDSLFLVK
ncbi:DUF6159 family protein [Flavilitoribacter nigricans]|uniref:Glycerophosphoryl diester phosphodiesterase membrane domain-containing protein n=1 Tax=Flavilitoribacter nigricans (strain ATCC 23147 / DSM 23189 / NBRC 102662 / NCIMB 1420 / SS-2) TaxID=1122177 RepID=A0A2D0NEF7_FLAN2|nr:DUF6159 family protein [Flavilitoribacter nigricans]PHN06569.1 hypothetical protein CRP01_09700 [Flavilitoribacter nigricans DSM 23189 = NBRC 102662]